MEGKELINFYLRNPNLGSGKGTLFLCSVTVSHHTEEPALFDPFVVRAVAQKARVELRSTNNEQLLLEGSVDLVARTLKALDGLRHV